MHWKSIITLFSLLVFFVSTTGVVVFEHHCSKAGDFIGFYANVDHDCSQEKEKQSCERTMHCCQTESDKDTPKFEEDCCTTDVSLVKIDSDYSLNNYELDFENDYTSIIAVYKDFDYLRGIIQEEPRGPPDFVQTQSKRRSIIQVYLI